MSSTATHIRHYIVHSMWTRIGSAGKYGKWADAHGGKNYLTIVLGRWRVEYVQQQKGVQAITTHIIHIYIQTRRKMYARGQEEWQRTHSKTVKQQQIWMWPILQGTQDLACQVLILTLFIVDFHLFPLLLWLLCTSLDRMVFGGKNALKWLVWCVCNGQSGESSQSYSKK